MLSNLDLPKGAPGNQKTGKQKLVHSQNDSGPKSLESMGISHSESSRSQQIAKLRDDVFEDFINESVTKEREPTTAAVLRMCKQERAKTKETRSMPTEIVDNYDELLKRKERFATIYADPPWPYQNQATRASTNCHYPTMSMEQILAEPVSKLADTNATLHLWVTSSFFQEGFEVLKAWGFEYKSSFIWVKPQIGLGNYWRIAHEIMLLGVRGKASFADKSQRSWLELDRLSHSEKPEEIRSLIEKVSLGPYLELYGRAKPKPGWTVYGK